MAKIKIKIGLCSKSKIVQNNWFFAPIFLFALSFGYIFTKTSLRLFHQSETKTLFLECSRNFQHFTENVEMPDLVDKGWFMPGMSFHYGLQAF